MVALEDLQPSKAREFCAKLMMQGRFDVGGSSARCRWLFCTIRNAESMRNRMEMFLVISDSPNGEKLMKLWQFQRVHR